MAVEVLALRANTHGVDAEADLLQGFLGVEILSLPVVAVEFFLAELVEVLHDGKICRAFGMQLEGQTSNIGHLRGDFASSGYGFYTTWFDTRPQWKTDEFKKELDKVINSLREDKGLLHNRYDMSAFAKH